jgi:hypothetical protein
MISGPRASSLGEEQGTTFNALMKGQGGDHITSSGIFENGLSASFYNNVLVVSASGNVGIGTSSPGGALDVKAGTGANILISADATNLVAINNYSAASGFQDLKFVGSNQLFFTGTAGGGSASEKMRITTSGSVGIGFTNPGAKLEVQDGANVAFSGTGYRLAIFSSTTAANADRPGITLGYDSTGGGIIAPATQAGTTNFLSFWTYNGSWAEKLRITKEGSVGIGCTPGSITSLDIQNASVTSNNVFLRLQNNAASEDCGLIISGSLGGSSYEHRIGVNTIIASKDLCFTNSNTVGYRWYTDGTNTLNLTSAGAATFAGSVNFNNQGNIVAKTSSVYNGTQTVTIGPGSYNGVMQIMVGVFGNGQGSQARAMWICGGYVGSGIGFTEVVRVNGGSITISTLTANAGSCTFTVTYSFPNAADISVTVIGTNANNSPATITIA